MCSGVDWETFKSTVTRFESGTVCVTFSLNTFEKSETTVVYLHHRLKSSLKKWKLLVTRPNGCCCWCFHVPRTFKDKNRMSHFTPVNCIWHKVLLNALQSLFNEITHRSDQRHDRKWWRNSSHSIDKPLFSWQLNGQSVTRVSKKRDLKTAEKVISWLLLFHSSHELRTSIHTSWQKTFDWKEEAPRKYKLGTTIDQSIDRPETSNLWSKVVILSFLFRETEILSLSLFPSKEVPIQDYSYHCNNHKRVNFVIHFLVTERERTTVVCIIIVWMDTTLISRCYRCLQSRAQNEGWTKRNEARLKLTNDWRKVCRTNPL
jgi:hypothetical protein